VRNGFDHTLKPIKNFNTEFTFTYAGTFYGKRKPDTFFKAMLALHADGKLPLHWKIQFIGTHHNFSIPVEFKDNSVFLEAVSNDTAVELLAKSDCNLLIHPPSEAKGIFTGKLFDYLSVYKPILALVDKEDVAAELIADCGAGFSCDFYSISEIKTAILEIIELWSNQELLDYQGNKIQQLHRRDKVKKLEKLLIDLM
jgi:glycosyltransferase involved in cell wall biosynthesis